MQWEFGLESSIRYNSPMCACRNFLLCLILIVGLPSSWGEGAKVAMRSGASEAAAGHTKMTVAGSDQIVFVSGEDLLTNKDIASAELHSKSAETQNISIVFSPGGKAKFAAATKALINRPLAILVDGKLISAPIVREQIKGGSAMITGKFSDAEVQHILAGLNGLDQ
jgi:preprotein translocase subunit SecD